VYDCAIRTKEVRETVDHFLLILTGESCRVQQSIYTSDITHSSSSMMRCAIPFRYVTLYRSPLGIPLTWLPIARRIAQHPRTSFQKRTRQVTPFHLLRNSSNLPLRTAKYRPAFLDSRRRKLQTWLAAVLMHPDIGGCPAVRQWILE
jgi:hypothetical protein